MSDKKASVNCGAALTISHASELNQQLRKAMETSSSVEIVADEVEKVDTAGLQLLVAFSRELEKVGGSIIWEKPSEVLTSAAVTLGLSSHLVFNQHS